MEPEPQFKIGDGIECDAIVGWVKVIYTRISADIRHGNLEPLAQFVYGIEEPEDGHTYYFTEEELSR